MISLLSFSSSDLVLRLWIQFQFEMLEDQPCRVGCRVRVDAESAKNFREKIDDEYRASM